MGAMWGKVAADILLQVRGPQVVCRLVLQAWETREAAAGVALDPGYAAGSGCRWVFATPNGRPVCQGFPSGGLSLLRSLATAGRAPWAGQGSIGLATWIWLGFLCAPVCLRVLAPTLPGGERPLRCAEPPGFSGAKSKAWRGGKNTVERP